jgi:hypothetical protein
VEADFISATSAMHHIFAKYGLSWGNTFVQKKCVGGQNQVV